jgi:hypothetical protein
MYTYKLKKMSQDGDWIRFSTRTGGLFALTWTSSRFEIVSFVIFNVISRFEIHSIRRKRWWSNYVKKEIMNEYIKTHSEAICFLSVGMLLLRPLGSPRPILSSSSLMKATESSEVCRMLLRHRWIWRHNAMCTYTGVVFPAVNVCRRIE